MPSKKTLSVFAVILAVSLSGMTSQAVAQDKPDQPAGASGEEAPADKKNVDKRYKELTGKAAKAYSAGKYAESLALFEKAYALKQVPNLLYNMGRIEEKRGNFEEAMSHYEKFVTQPGVDIKARKDALERMSTLREVVALRKKGEDVDKETIEEKHDDRELAAAKEMDGQAGKTRIERDYTAAYVTLGLAVASYGTAGFFALQARDANSDFENATSRSARRDAASSGQTSAIVADSMLGLGVVMTGLSVYFFLSPSETEVPADQTAMHLAPQIGPDGAGMSFAVEF